MLRWYPRNGEWATIRHALIEQSVETHFSLTTISEEVDICCSWWAIQTEDVDETSCDDLPISIPPVPNQTFYPNPQAGEIRLGYRRLRKQDPGIGETRPVHTVEVGEHQGTLSSEISARDLYAAAGILGSMIMMVKSTRELILFRHLFKHENHHLSQGSGCRVLYERCFRLLETNT